jgi:hypothetical protein
MAGLWTNCLREAGGCVHASLTLSPCGQGHSTFKNTSPLRLTLLWLSDELWRLSTPLVRVSYQTRGRHTTVTRPTAGALAAGPQAQAVPTAETDGGMMATKVDRIVTALVDATMTATALNVGA